MDPIEFIFIAFGALVLYLSFLRNRILDKIDAFQGKRKAPFGFNFFPSTRFFLPVKFEFYDEYPDKEILKLSRKYDKLLGVFYIAFGILVVIMVAKVMLQQFFGVFLF